MTRGHERWENRDLRETFPLPSERKSEPRFDGLYRDSDAGDVRFERDGTLLWNGQAGVWHVHGQALRVQAGSRHCEGAFSSTAIYLLCAEGTDRDSRSQVVLAFTPDA